jgi:metal-responsive CopG/Arc/MetJ family transcriptional regulator
MAAGKQHHGYPSLEASGTKVMTVRLPEELAAELDVVARAEEVSVSETVRAAIYRHIATRRADERFQGRLREQLEKDREVIERLAS